ncbi:phosphonate C-P lyase system protein PhnH [Rhodoplanes sp. SY1]|uniref:phosphonate C-P lyase system protein PhnH n=1 Tax=Rhodoplanes sp. SY1 TaxID=3166646 RepID=UPI0038B4805D
MDARLSPGFRDPVNAAQAVFRAVMDALARPGTAVPLGESVALAPPAPLRTGAAAVALTLLDQDTPVWLDPPLAAAPAVAAWLRFHTAAPVVDDPAAASFALVSDPTAMPSFGSFAPGTPDYPDRSATLILQVDDFAHGPLLILAGPGIPGRRLLQATPLPDDIAARLVANRALFPCGIDLVLVTDTAVAALPRSVTLGEGT